MAAEREELEQEAVGGPAASRAPAAAGGGGPTALAGMVLRLQAAAGNAAVARLAAQGRLSPAPPAGQVLARDPGDKELALKGAKRVEKQADKSGVATMILGVMARSCFPDSGYRGLSFERSVKGVKLSADKMLVGGDDLVEQVAKGNIDAMVASMGQALGRKPQPWQASEANPAGTSGGGRFRVILVNRDTHLPTGVLEAARDTIDAELDKVAGGSKVKTVQAGFDVSFDDEMTDDEASALTKRDFAVYLYRKAPSEATVREVLTRHLGLTGSVLQKRAAEVATQLAKEGGANLAQNGRGASFVSTAKIVELMHEVSEKNLPGAYKQYGRRIGELCLHELGHHIGISAHTKEGLMQETVDVSTFPGSTITHQTYSAATVTTLQGKLNALDK